MLSQAINVYALAGTNRDKQWVNIVLKYLKLWSNGSIDESLTLQDDSTTYIANLVESLKLVVDKLSERLWSFLPLAQSVISPESHCSAYLYPDHPAFSVRILDTSAVRAEDEDGSFLHVSLLNSLPCVSAYLVLGSV